MSETPEQAPAEVEAKDETPAADDYKDRWEAQRKVNRDLERKLNEANAKLQAAESETQSAVESERQRTTAAEMAAVRFRLAAQYGISVTPGEDDSPSEAELFLTGADEATMAAQAQRLAARAASDAAPRNPIPDPTQGGNGTTPPGTTGEQFASFIQSKL